MPTPLKRRDFLKAVGVAAPLVPLSASAAGAAPVVPPSTSASGATPVVGEENLASSAATADGAIDVATCLSPTEWAFMQAVSDVMIPADELTASGSDLGIPLFIDRQLGGAFGNGARLYRAGPFKDGSRTQGYQLPMSPREYFGAGIAAINALTLKIHGKEFDRLASSAQNEFLEDLGGGKLTLDELDGRQFVNALVAIVMEGFFSDPLYGGNRGKASWKMMGFPGLPALYTNKMLPWRGKPYVVEPQSIADQS